MGSACIFAKMLAAGLMFICPEDSTVFLTRRSAICSEPGVWALPGGGYEPKDLRTAGNDRFQAPMATATREAVEELGCIPASLNAVDAYKTESDSGVHYVTYIILLPEEARRRWLPRIRLNEENDMCGWFPIDEPPEPMHPGVQAVLDRCSWSR